MGLNIECDDCGRLIESGDTIFCSKCYNSYYNEAEELRTEVEELRDKIADLENELDEIKGDTSRHANIIR